jgi:hypothetical protein
MVGGLFILVFVLALACFAGRAEAVPIPTVDKWLVIDALQGKVDETKPGKDSFLLKGYFHCTPESFDPTTSDVTVAVDNHVITIPAGQWTKQGANKFKAKFSNVSAQIDYWVKGSGRCNFMFVGTKQTMGTNVPNFPVLPVRVAVTPSIDLTVLVSMEEFGSVAKMDTLGPRPLYVINKIEVKRNFKAVKKDAYKIWGQLYLSEEFDPAVNGIYVSLGPSAVEILPGEVTSPASGNKLKFAKMFPDGTKIAVDANTETGKILVMVSNVDLSGFSNPPTAYFAITAMDDAAWGFVTYLQKANKTGSLFKF